MDRTTLASRVLGETIVSVAFIYFTLQLFSSTRPWIFFDYTNLSIHEGGHVIFWPFGMFMHILGGSLFQCLVPLMFALYFFFKKALFSSVFCIFWLGDNLINVSVYINDATTMTLPLFVEME